MFTIRFDTILAQKKFKEMADRLGPKETAKGIASALNRVASSGKTTASRQIRGKYRIKKSDLDKRMGTSKAGAKHLKAAIWSYGAPIPLRYFKYRQTKRGVKVTVAGRPQLIPGAFVATMKNGHRGVFARGRYDDKGFKFRTRRVRKSMRLTKSKNDLPITALHTLSQGAMFSNPNVINPVIDRVESMLVVRIEHELNRLISKL